MRNVFLIVLEVGKSKTKMPASSVSGEAPFPGSLLAVTSLGRRGQGSFLSLLYKGTNPIHTGSSLHDLIISRRPCLPSTVTLELGFQHPNLGGHEMRPWQIPHGAPAWAGGFSMARPSSESVSGFFCSLILAQSPHCYQFQKF